LLRLDTPLVYQGSIIVEITAEPIFANGVVAQIQPTPG
jgi:hypothetical protein